MKINRRGMIGRGINCNICNSLAGNDDDKILTPGIKLGIAGVLGLLGIAVLGAAALKKKEA